MINKLLGIFSKDIDCPTKFPKTYSKNKELGENFISDPVTDENQIFKTLAEESLECWDKLGRGRIKFAEAEDGEQIFPMESFTYGKSHE